MNCVPLHRNPKVRIKPNVYTFACTFPCAFRRRLSRVVDVLWLGCGAALEMQERLVGCAAQYLHGFHCSLSWLPLSRVVRTDVHAMRCLALDCSAAKFDEDLYRQFSAAPTPCKRHERWIFRIDMGVVQCPIGSVGLRRVNESSATRARGRYAPKIFFQM